MMNDNLDKIKQEDMEKVTGGSGEPRTCSVNDVELYEPSHDINDGSIKNVPYEPTHDIDKQSK